MRVLVLTDYYLPGYLAGGPLRTLANMVAQLGDELSFSILTRDRDFGAAEPYPGVTPGVWHEVENAQVLYLSPGELTLRRLSEVIRATVHDVLYLNSFFSRPFTIKPLLLRRLGWIPELPLVLAPRGEFSPGALRLKAARKRLFLAAAQAGGLYRGVLWQASSPFEQQDIRRWFGPDALVRVAPDLPAAADAAGGAPRPEKQPDRLRLVFLSRISRKKNLDGALRMLSGLNGSVELNIYGPLEDPLYWAECQRLAERLPTSVQVEYRGVVEHERVGEVLRQHDLFFLPTLGENFGHVILEALRAGCPVLLSDQTPWRNLAAEGVGWDLPLVEPDAFRAVLQRCLDMSAEEHGGWCARAASFGRRRSQDAEVLRQNRELFRYACARVTLEARTERVGGVTPLAASEARGRE